MLKDNGSFEVGRWRVEPERNLLACEDESVRLEPKVIAVLSALAERAGEVVSREELLTAVWPETFVTEAVLTRAVSELRRALGDDQKSPRYVETIPRRGYRLIAPVRRASESGAERPTIAVLPFTDLSPSPRDDYFADGLTEMLITELARVKDLRVISATSVRSFRSTEKLVPEIASALGADLILEGTVTAEGDDLRTTAQLIDAVSDIHLWAQSYTRKVAGMLALQGEISRQVADRIGAALLPQPRVSMAPTSVDPAALDAYLRGRHLYGRRTGESVSAALTAFEEVISIEPRLAIGHAGVADVYTLQGHYGYERPDRVAGLARAAAERALELDPDSGEALTSKGKIELLFDWRAEPAKDLFDRALEVSPSHAPAYLGLADALQVLGRYEDALGQMEAGYRVNPLDPGMSMNRAGFLLVCGRVGESLDQLEKTLEVAPEILPARLLMVRTLAEAGRLEAAEAALAPAIAARADDPNVRLSRAWIVGAQGRKEEAGTELRAIEAESDHPPLLALARSWIFLGELDEAGRLFDEAARQRLPGALIVSSHPGFAPLLDDPRMRVFRESVGLPVRP